MSNNVPPYSEKCRHVPGHSFKPTPLRGAVQPVRPAEPCSRAMNCPELTHEQYIATMAMPMRLVEAEDDSHGPFPIGEVVDSLIQRLSLPTTREAMDIYYVYMNDRDHFCHILFNWGVGDVYLVLVAKPQERRVQRYRVLDLNAEYGFGAKAE
jgi:hypothetical protein